jgi:chorismate dehydratase
LETKQVVPTNKLLIGEIPYANLFPIFYMLKRESDISGYEFIKGVPSDLNKMIRGGRIDVSPSSSIEYLRHRDKYELIENHSISSIGPVGSILLFSNKPVEKLGRLTVLTSSQSETSVALIRIVLNKFYELDCSFQTSNEKLKDAIGSSAAYLLIGDEALIEAMKWHGLYIYDIGELWYKHTGLPFTFALWIANKDCRTEKSELYRKFIDDLNRAKTSALNSMDIIAASCPLKDIISEEALISYWKKMSYDFTDEHRKGLELFNAYAKELGLI